jgi:hypothetical protein
MKLVGENVRKHILTAIKNGSVLELRDNMPVINIEGVKCAVDDINGVIQTGEGRNQRWFEVYMRDVTPKRFLTPKEQLDLDRKHADWWVITSSQRTCFVRNCSRSGAIKAFLERFPDESSSDLDGPEAELARGLEFIDDRSE